MPKISSIQLKKYKYKMETIWTLEATITTKRKPPSNPHKTSLHCSQEVASIKPLQQASITANQTFFTVIAGYIVGGHCITASDQDLVPLSPLFGHVFTVTGISSSFVYPHFVVVAVVAMMMILIIIIWLLSF